MLNKNSKIIVTGVKGQLGYDCVRELTKRGFNNVIGIDREELDITNKKAVMKYITDNKPDVVMHNAAWTAVDNAEHNKFEVYKVNALGAKYLAMATRDIGAKIVYISTDYVFSGDGDKFYEIDDEIHPKSTYGITKFQGEEFVREMNPKHFIVRISWVFGFNGNNFVKTMLKLADKFDELNIVDDQIGSPTYTYDLSILLCDMIETEKYGTYHATNEGVCSWADFAEEIFRITNKNVSVHKVTTAEYKTINPNQTDRPLNSRLSKSKLDSNGFARLPIWKDALARYIDELKQGEK